MMDQDAALAWWDTPQNAACYDRYCQRYGYYREAALALAGAARLQPGQFVVDLACGTGVSTQPIVERVGPDGLVIGLDPAAAMIEMALQKTWPRNVSFRHGDASTISALDPSRGIDRVLCSSAVWLIEDLSGALATICGALCSDGAFCFTMPSEYAGESDHLLERNAQKFWQELWVVREQMGLQPPPARVDAPDYSLHAWRCRLKQAGFSRTVVERHRYQQTHEEWFQHLQLPAVLHDYLPAASEPERDAFVRQLGERVTSDLTSERRWIIMIAWR